MDAKGTLAALIAEAESATAKMGMKNPNRSLVLRLCAYGLAVTQRCADLERQVEDTPRIILP